MIRYIMELIRHNKLMSAVESDVKEMFDLAELLFDTSSCAAIDGKPVEFDLYAKDREINLVVINTRRRILEHLTISQKHQIVGELVLLTLVNNIERIGDHSKNMYDLYRRLDGPLDESFYLPMVKDLKGTVLGFFPEARKALFEDDDEAANHVMDGHLEVVKAYKGLMSDLLYDEEIKARQAAALTVLLRSIKRVSSHLKTVSSAAVSPFMMLGFRQMPDVDKGIVDDE